MTSPESTAPACPPHFPRRRTGRLFWGGLLLLLFASIGIFWLTSPERFPFGKHDDNPPKVIFQLSYEPPRLLGRPANPNAQAEAEAFRQSQAAIVRFRHVIEQALLAESLPGAPPLLATAPDQANLASWIQDRLHVGFPAPEIMELTLPGVPRADAVRFLNALAKQYLEEVVGHEKSFALERVSQLEKTYRDLATDVRQKRSELKHIEERFGTPTDGRLRSVNLAAFEAMLENLNRMRVDLIHKEERLAHRQKSATDVTSVSDDEIALEIERDPTLAAISTRRMILQTLLSEPQADSAAALPPERGLWEQELTTLTKLEAARRETLRQSVAERLKGAAARERNSEVTKLRDEVALLTRIYERLEAESIQRERKLKEGGRTSIEVEMMQADLETVKEIKSEVARAYQRERIEFQQTSGDENAHSSSRIRVLTFAK